MGAPASGTTSRKNDPPVTIVPLPEIEIAGPPLGSGTES